jgi:hypothetical protein
MKMVDGSELDPKVAALVPQGESILFAAVPRLAITNRGEQLKLPFLLLTDHRLALVKDRLFRPRFDFEVEWSKVSSVEGQLWAGAAGVIRLTVSAPNGAPLVDLIVQAEHAVAVESAIRERLT